MEARAMDSANPINPQRIIWELSPRLPDNCIISADSGSIASWYARDLKIRLGMKASLSGTLATMGPGVPYAIGAKFAYPDRVPIGLIGDGAMQMLGINGLITVSKYWKTWSDPRFIVLVLNNRDLNQVTWEQRIMAGDAKFEGSQDVPDFAYDEYAKMLGLEGIRIDKPEDVESALDAAMAAQRPVVINAYTDPSVPPMPPHVSFKEMKNFTSAIFKGDEDSWDMIKQSFKEVADNYLPHK